MDFRKLSQLSHDQLVDIARSLEQSISGSRKSLERRISEDFKLYENYLADHNRKYRRISRLGNEGKEGVTYLVSAEASGDEYAMKVFRRHKSASTLRKEADLQEQAAQYGAAPYVIEVDTVMKTIVMDKMDRHFIEVLYRQNGVLSESQQKAVIKLFKRLDEAGVFHGDSNILNYMFKGKRLYLIDYGMSKPIDNPLIKKLKTSTPNMDLMSLAFILKMKELGIPSSSCRVIAEEVSRKSIHPSS